MRPMFSQNVPDGATSILECGSHFHQQTYVNAAPIFTNSCEKRQVLKWAVEYILQNDKFLPKTHLHIR